MALTKLEIIQHKIVNLNTLLQEVSAWRLKGQNIVFTNGCFDLLHPGHIEVLMQAAQLGNKLVVGINADASVRRLKGSTRPINTVESRALVLASLLYVDAVCIFEEDTPLSLIEALSPDVLVKGGDYIEDSVVGASWMKSKGGKVVIVPTLAGHSTTGTISKMQ
jgi:rfaE bifunctional protein nucleotidyltransferase chain/domain